MLERGPPPRIREMRNDPCGLTRRLPCARRSQSADAWAQGAEQPVPRSPQLPHGRATTLAAVLDLDAGRAGTPSASRTPGISILPALRRAGLVLAMEDLQGTVHVPGKIESATSASRSGLEGHLLDGGRRCREPLIPPVFARRLVGCRRYLLRCLHPCSLLLGLGRQFLLTIEGSSSAQGCLRVLGTGRAWGSSCFERWPNLGRRHPGPRAGERTNRQRAAAPRQAAWNHTRRRVAMQQLRRTPYGDAIT
mmetsp:Transcript_28465/g.78420  ORF Transcript_28465/g.78420 Transcript_28465/m.78420 type:complete len:250 (+) Transcript_28465:1321-2070(+)